MPRLNIEIPEDVYRFSVEQPVRFPDINAGNHLGADKMVTMIVEARDLFLVHLGHRECEPGLPNVLITDLSVVYRAEVPPRCRLRFDVGAMDFNRYGGSIVTRVSFVGSGVVAAYARAGFVFFDSVAKRVVPMPDAFRSAITSGVVESKS